MQEADTRPVKQLIIDLHKIASELERKNPLSAKVDAFELRKIADRLSLLERMERTL